jgi:putative serine/threonine protein kinase
LNYCIPILDCSHKFFITSPNLANLICYPKFNAVNYATKIKDLFLLDLKFIILEGNTVLYNNNILGKGCEGLVLKVENIKKEIMALKIKRTDSCRFSMKNEFDFYKLANMYKIGPKVYSFTVDMLLMEFLDGFSAEYWFLKTKLDPCMIKTVVISILNQCFTLDKINLDHGQLNKLYNHIIISPDDLKCTIIDFESASKYRKVSNLTSAFQGLLFKGIISKQIQKYIDYENKKNEFLKLLTKYKRDISQENFDSIISLI